jgi:hypothetical protein
MRKVLNDISPNCRIFEVANNTKGPINAIHQIFDFIDNNKQTIVSYCDYGAYWDFENFINYVNDKNLDGAIPCYTGFHPHMLGSDNYAFCKENNMELIQIKEKEPFTDNKMNEYASNGTYYFKSGNLLKEYSYTFILQHPNNIIVIPIIKPHLYLIKVYQINNNIVKNIDLHKFYSNNINIFNSTNIGIPNIYPINSYYELINYFASMNTPYYYPGIMIYHKNGERTKFINPVYESIKFIRSNQPKLLF